MESCELGNSQRDRIEGFLPGPQGWVGVTGKDNRSFVNGVLWVLLSGAQRKDLPAQFGNRKSVHKRFTRGPDPESGRGYSRCRRMTRTTAA